MAIANKYLKIRYIKLTLLILKFDAASIKNNKKTYYTNYHRIALNYVSQLNLHWKATS